MDNLANSLANLKDAFNCVMREIQDMPVSSITEIKARTVKLNQFADEFTQPLKLFAEEVLRTTDNETKNIKVVIEKLSNEIDELKKLGGSESNPNKVSKNGVTNTKSYASVLGGKAVMVDDLEKKQIRELKVNEELPTGNTTKVNIVSNVSIDAIKIENPADCKNYPGWLCYREFINGLDCKVLRFYYWLNGHVIEAYVTNINSRGNGRSTPRKWAHHTCKHGTRCRECVIKESDFYVLDKNDTMEIPDYQFVPASKVPENFGLYSGKTYVRLGSKDSLVDDLKDVTMDDVDRIGVIAGNFLLCQIIALDRFKRNSIPRRK